MIDVKEAFEGIKHFFRYTGEIHNICSNECIGFYNNLCDSDTDICLYIDNSIEKEDTDYKTIILFSIARQKTIKEIIHILRKHKSSIEIGINVLKANRKLLKTVAPDFEPLPILPPIGSVKPFKIDNSERYKTIQLERRKNLFEEQIERFENEKIYIKNDYTRKIETYKIILGMIDNAISYLENLQEVPPTDTKPQVLTEPKADNESGQKEQPPEINTFAELLRNPDDLVKIRAVLSDAEQLKSDGMFNISKAKNADKSVIRAMYAALKSNALLKDENDVLFSRLVEIEFGVPITDKSLRNVPTKNGTDKVSEFYREFLKKFPKVQR